MARDLTKYRQAAGSYVGLGVVIVLLTTLFIPAETHYRSGFIPLLVGIVVLLAFSFFIAKGIRWLTVAICALSVMRTGWWMYSFFNFGNEASSWVYPACALLQGAIVCMLARAVWGGEFLPPERKMSGAVS